MAKGDGDFAQYNLRLNLNNPIHMKIYRALESYSSMKGNTKTQYIIDALVSKVTGHSEETLKNINELTEGYVSKAELDEKLKEQKKEILTEVVKYLDKKKTEPDSEIKDQVQDKTLEELSVMFSQGNFE